MFKKKNQQGFTLVELMVVIVIIGILAAMAIPKFLGATNKTKVSEAKPVLKEIYTLQSAYQIEKGSYSGSATDIGFVSPSGVSRFTYTVTNKGTTLGNANLNEKIDVAAIGDDICIDSVAALKASTANLAGLANVTSSSCP